MRWHVAIPETMGARRLINQAARQGRMSEQLLRRAVNLAKDRARAEHRPAILEAKDVRLALRDY